ncbi:MAG TPA: hypothetical protein VFF68_07230 [Anaerolineaceae bacterium]|nr:hypothetical protein [Anaerolineaceae bacterium]
MSLTARLPRPIQLLMIGLGTLSLTGWFRLWQALVFWRELAAVELRPGPAYLAASGAALGILGAAAAWRLAKRRAGAPSFVRLVVLGAALLYWAERLLFTRSAGGYANLPFSIMLTVLALVYTFTALAWWQRRGFHPSLRIENEHR